MSSLMAPGLLLRKKSVGPAEFAGSLELPGGVFTIMVSADSSFYAVASRRVNTPAW